MCSYRSLYLFPVSFLFMLLAGTASAVVSTGDYDDRKDTECIGCHINVTPGIVKQCPV